ncbi:predicted protein [Uncinocarpus reesii 1704]|uniref:Uncharacterized protein n=1 Tax=Uncinocarpus reesii (strain UAMH 1704) TaxID=336963 RepID=C4JH79_UNCRE|nr:uncharacterized protein UREG_02652 [Uncinocarpus reesii 1704]EEP77803.1 predicted protein [Uncinocarpus reesii 1704]
MEAVDQRIALQNMLREGEVRCMQVDFDTDISMQSATSAQNSESMSNPEVIRTSPDSASFEARQVSLHHITRTKKERHFEAIVENLLLQNQTKGKKVPKKHQQFTLF